MLLRYTFFGTMLMLFLCVGTALADRPAIPSGVRAPGSINPVRVTVPEVFLRNCAGPSCTIIGTLYKGNRIQIQETVREWVRVLNIDSGLEGWCKKSELSPKTIYKFARVKASALHFRSCGGMQCSIMDKLPKGQTMTVLTHEGSWTKVRLHSDKRVGWVATRYLIFYN